MTLHPIDIDETKNGPFVTDKACTEILNVYPDFYKRVGFHPPWIGYFVKRGDEFVGGGGFKSKPKDGKVEIAYTTFKAFEGHGIGTQICKMLVDLSLQTDPGIQIMARTFERDNASARILQKNKFVSQGQVWDDEDGNVWEWRFKS